MSAYLVVANKIPRGSYELQLIFHVEDGHRVLYGDDSYGPAKVLLRVYWGGD